MIDCRMSLTVKQQLFVNEYLACFNATEAARRAGYNATNGSLATIGYENLRKPEILEKIKQQLQERAMIADEVLMRLADQARGDIGVFATVNSSSDLQKHSQSYLIKKFKKKMFHPKNGDPYEEIEIEIYDAHAALVDIGKYHALFTDKTEHDVKIVAPITMVEIIKPE